LFFSLGVQQQVLSAVHPLQLLLCPCGIRQLLQGYNAALVFRKPLQHLRLRSVDLLRRRRHLAFCLLKVSAGARRDRPQASCLRQELQARAHVPRVSSAPIWRLKPAMSVKHDGSRFTGLRGSRINAVL
jgi:hypothetical protein